MAKLLIFFLSLLFLFSPQLSVIATAETTAFFHREGSVDLPGNSGWLKETSTRKRLLLNGTWEYQKQDDQVWEKVGVPLAYEEKGEFIFRRNFQPDSSFIGKHFKLVAYGINYHCTIFINDRFVGSHEGGHSSFTVDVEDGLIVPNRPNHIQIKIDNRLSAKSTIPLKHLPLGWRNYGGIYRDLFLLATAKTSVENLRLKYEFEKGYQNCRLTATVTVRSLESSGASGLAGADGKLQCYLELWREGEAKPVDRSAPAELFFAGTISTQAKLELQVDQPALWSPDSPARYEVQVFVVRGDQLVDEYREDIGLQEVKMVGGELRLNGRRIKLNGVNWYEDYPKGGVVANSGAIAEEIAGIKTLGANAVRVVGHPPDPAFVENCDRQGLWVLEEIPVYYIPPKQLSKATYLEKAEKVLTELITRDRNHPSVLTWGLGTGLDMIHPNSQKFLTAAVALAKELDERPVYVTSRSPEKERQSAVGDFVFLDLSQSREDQLVQIVNQIHGAFPDKPLLLTTGFDLFRPAFGVMDSIASEESQAYQLEKALKVLRDVKGVEGNFITAYADWVGSYPILPPGPRNDAADYPFGLRSRTRERRVSFHVVQALFTGDKLPNVSIRSFARENPNTYPVVGLGVIIVFLFFYKRDRRLRGNLRRIFIHPHGVYVDIKENRKIHPPHSLFLGILTSVGISLWLSSFAFFFKRSFLFDEILSLLIPNGLLKERLIWLIWQPGWFVLVFSLLIFLVLVFTTIGIRILAFLLGRFLPLGQVFTFTFWVSASYLFAIPIGMICYRLLPSPGVFMPCLVIFALFHLWFIVRFFRGLKVVFTFTRVKTVLLFLVIMALTVGIGALYYERTQAIFEYGAYYLSFLR